MRAPGGACALSMSRAAGCSRGCSRARRQHAGCGGEGGGRRGMPAGPWLPAVPVALRVEGTALLASRVRLLPGAQMGTCWTVAVGDVKSAPSVHVGLFKLISGES